MTAEPATPVRRSVRNRLLASGTPTSPRSTISNTPKLVGRTEAVLHGAQQAQRVVPVAFEAEHRVDDVLEHPRAGEAAVFGDMADEHHRNAAALGLGDEPMGAAAHLHDAAGRRAEVGIGDGLDAVDDDELRLHGVECGDDVGKRCLGEQPQVGTERTEPFGAQAHLLGALLAADVQRARRPAGGQLQQQRALADAGLAAEQRDATRERDRRRALDRARRCRSTADRRPTCRPRRSAWPCALDVAEMSVAMSGSGPSTSSTIEFHASHDGQRPAHLRIGGGACGAAIDETKLRHELHPRRGCYTASRSCVAAVRPDACADERPRR